MKMADIQVGERYLVGEGEWKRPAIVLETYADYTTATEWHGTAFPTKGHVNHGKGVVVEYGGNANIETVRPNAIVRTMVDHEVILENKERLKADSRNRIMEHNERVLMALSTINNFLGLEIKAENKTFHHQAGQYLLGVDVTASQPSPHLVLSAPLLTHVQS